MRHIAPYSRSAPLHPETLRPRSTLSCLVTSASFPSHVIPFRSALSHKKCCGYNEACVKSEWRWRGGGSIPTIWFSRRRRRSPPPISLKMLPRPCLLYRSLSSPLQWASHLPAYFTERGIPSDGISRGRGERGHVL